MARGAVETAVEAGAGNEFEVKLTTGVPAYPADIKSGSETFLMRKVSWVARGLTGSLG